MINRQKSGVLREISFVLAAFLVVATLLGSQTVFSSAANPQAYNNVQVFIKTQNAADNSFLVSAYNSTGGLVATSQSEYPALSLELPSGTYLLTVVASQPYDYKTPQPLVYAQTSSAIAYPISGYSPAEYGYSVLQVSNSTTIDISTAPISDLKTAQITVHVHYLNGSAVSGASVGASIVGAWYWIYDSNIMLWNQTDANGVATLTVPSVPVEVTAWSWVQVNLPTSQTTTQVNIGGEKVNVTVYWQPTYVGLAGEALIIPPETSASITLHSQQPTYWVTPYGVQTGQTTGGLSPSQAIASSRGGVPANQYSVVSNIPSGSVVTTLTTSQISSPPSTTTSTTTTIPSSSNITLLGIGLIVAIVVAAFALILALRKK